MESTELTETQPTVAETVPETLPVQDTQPTEIVLPEPRDSDFVAVKEYIPDIVVELKYATEDNFTGQKIYEFRDAYLRYGTVKKLAKVQDELRLMGVSIKLWDAFRPISGQRALWEACPDPTYVSPPETGGRPHCRGGAIDITLVNSDGEELEMPTGFDDFSALADRDYSDCTEAAADNARFLEDIMAKHGFSGYFGEWWHFNDLEKYPLEECFDPAVISWWYADCQEFISLRTEPDTSAEVITRILVKEEFQVLGYTGAFAMVDYQGQRGYVLASYMEPVQ